MTLFGFFTAVCGKRQAVCGLVLLLPCLLLVCSWPDTSVPIEELLEAPTSLDRGGRSLVLYASLARDYMPVDPPGGLMLYVKVWCADSLPTNTDLTTDLAWAIDRPARAVWETAVDTGGAWNPHGFLRAAAEAEGPKWEVGRLCDVMVRLTDSEGNVWLLRAPDVEIEKVW